MRISPYPLIFLEAPVILEDEDKQVLEQIQTNAKTDEERLKEVPCKCGGKCRNAGTRTEDITLNLGLDGICIQEWDPKLTSLRIEEYTSVRMIAKDNVVFMASYSTRAHTVYEAATNIGRTVFVCLVLSMASIYFTKDAQNLVVDPLERMIEKVKLISRNPLAAATEEINEAGIFTFMGKDE